MTDTPPRGLPLTERQVQILDGLSRGQSRAQIARQLVLSELTVKSHCARIRQRLDARSITHAVGIAFRAGALQ